MRGALATSATVALLTTLHVVAAAQQPRLPTPPGTGSPLPPGNRPPPSAVAPPDTAQLMVTAPHRWPTPTAIVLRPDTLRFGDVAYLALEFDEPVPDFAPDSLRFSAAWAVPAAGIRPAAGSAGADLATGGLTAEVPLRIYRAGPVVAQWAVRSAGAGPLPAEAGTPTARGPTAAVVVVTGRTAGTDQIAPIRPPRLLGWAVAILVGAGLALLLLALLGWWLWRRRRPRALPADRALAPPPELAVVEQLWDLEAKEWPASGDERRYLDRLIRVIRGYLQERYHLPAGELTAAEVVPAGVRLGYRTDRLAGYAALIAAGDQRRYQPGPIPRAACREQMARVVALLGAERTAGVMTPVAPQVRLAADQAWEKLLRRYAPAAADPAQQAPPAGPAGGTP